MAGGTRSVRYSLRAAGSRAEPPARISCRTSRWTSGIAALDRNLSVIAHLEAGGCVLTAGLRQARIVRRLHDRAQISAGRRVWPTAQVFPLDAWLMDLWRDAGAERDDLPQPLPDAALDWLWRRHAQRDASGLIDAAALGARARQSWLALRAHLGSVEALPQFPLTRDQQAFTGWARGVEARLRERNACDPKDLPRLFVERQTVPRPGAPVLLAGFRRLSPARAALFEAFRAQGWSIRLDSSEAPASQRTHRYAAAEPESERHVMLAWIRQRLEWLPGGLHALVVPNLESQRGALERALEATLQPDAELPAAARATRIFDLAAGAALSLQPVVESALDGIAAALEDLDWPRTSRMLRSSYFTGATTETEARVRLDVAMRRAPGVAAPTVAGLAARSRAAGASHFAASLEAARGAAAGAARRHAGDWAECFGACLAAMGWPGERPFSSREFQAARHFREVLREMAATSPYASELGAREAIDELRRLAAAPFQPESGEPAILVLDAYDDPGVRFDSLWVAGLTAAAWPRPVAIDPMLPIEVQRRLGMPRVTAEACVAEAREIVGAWRAASGELVLSWPCRENDTETDGSPLVPTDAADLVSPATLPMRDRLAFGATRLEPVPDAALPALAGPAQGGARVIELQAQCPFRAFALLRLHADPLEEPQTGVDRRQRGIALHRALERLWGDLGSQSALLALSQEERNARVARTVDRALAETLPAGSGPRTVALERDWQCRAIRRLLELDAVRPPFTVVETERSLAGRIGGLELGLRVDRVDRVGTALVVIDYKSGTLRKAPWRGARMDAPQLPLYAVLHPAHPTAIAMAELGASGASLRGVARDEGLIDSLTPAADFELSESGERGFSWERIREYWFAWFERLASDHARGRAEADPKLGAETCRICHLAALCRVAAAPADAIEDEDDDE